VYLQPSAAGRLVARISPRVELHSIKGPEVGRYIASRTGRDDLIYNLGLHGEIYFYANRRPASRFFHEFSVIDNEGNLRQLLRDLEANRPTYIVDTQWPQYLEGTSVKYLSEIGDFIDQNYVLEKRMEFDPKDIQMYEKAIGRSDSSRKLTYQSDIYRLKEAGGSGN